MTPHDFASELCALALAVERAGRDPEQQVLARLEFEALWAKYRAYTQIAYDACRVEAAEEFQLQLSQDLAPVLKVIK